MNANVNTQIDNMVDNKEEAIKQYCNDIINFIHQDVSGLKIAWNMYLIEGCKDRNVVYFIENAENHNVKIGKTTDLITRLKRLQDCASQIGMPLPHLKCRCVICCSTKKECHALEKELHNRYKSKRCVGEWFNISIEEIKKYLDKCYAEPIIINNILVYCGLPDVEDMEMPLIIGDDYNRFVDLLNYLKTHSFEEHNFWIKKYCGITFTEATNIYCQYKNRRLDDFIKDFYAPYLPKNDE
jgi:DNA-binding ferritin-like protein (Dps family)